MPDISEKNFEATIEALLLAGGSDSSIQGETAIREAATVEGDIFPAVSENACRLTMTKPCA